MEDFFQVIIILFFILSSIASSFQKKKKQREKLEKQRKATEPITVTKEKTVKPAAKKSSSEMLEELLGFKIDLPEPQKQEAPKDFSEDSIKTEQTWNPEEDFGEHTKKEFKPYVSEQKKYAVSKTQSSFSKKIDTKDSVTIKSTNTNKNKLSKKLFASNSNLKDYIVIQEILNKPKALRR